MDSAGYIHYIYSVQYTQRPTSGPPTDGAPVDTDEERLQRLLDVATKEGRQRARSRSALWQSVRLRVETFERSFN